MDRLELNGFIGQTRLCGSFLTTVSEAYDRANIAKLPAMPTALVAATYRTLLARLDPDDRSLYAQALQMVGCSFALKYESLREYFLIPESRETLEEALAIVRNALPEEGACPAPEALQSEEVTA